MLKSSNDLFLSGPGNIQLVGHLPTAQEPRSSVLHHTANAITNTTASTWRPPTEKLNRSADPQPQSLLSLLSNTRCSPTVPESRTEKVSGLNDKNEAKSPLLNLSLSTSSSRNGKSDSDSLGSPHSTRSTTDSNRSQASPPANSGPNDGTPERTDVEKVIFGFYS